MTRKEDKVEIKKYTEYCTGCGLCRSVNGVDFINDEKGFPVPQLRDKDINLCNNVCLASGKIPFQYDGNIWGNETCKYVAFSSDNGIREYSSSGGVLTSLCIYLLEAQKVDGIIQVRADSKKPYNTKVCISTSREDVIKCAGSRYAISSPLMNILQAIDKHKKYAFVGKPCDVLALRNYSKVSETISNTIQYYLSFFCAGEPSEDANIKLIQQLGCKGGDDCKSLVYRGNGWPGFATAVNKEGISNQMTYDESWGKILGRDIHKVCRVCSDGTGDAADIACGDAWYSKSDGTPDFSEHEGRNIVFTRTSKGQEVFNDAIKLEYIKTDNGALNSVNLRNIQNYQFTRKSTLRSMQKAYRFCGLNFPSYDKKMLKRYGSYSNMRVNIKRFLGVIKRHMEGKI